jgi:hypothetical protein
VGSLSDASDTNAGVKDDSVRLGCCCCGWGGDGGDE